MSPGYVSQPGTRLFLHQSLPRLLEVWVGHNGCIQCDWESSHCHSASIANFHSPLQWVPFVSAAYWPHNDCRKDEFRSSHFHIGHTTNCHPHPPQELYLFLSRPGLGSGIPPSPGLPSPQTRHSRLVSQHRTGCNASVLGSSHCHRQDKPNCHSHLQQVVILFSLPAWQNHNGCRSFCVQS